MYTIQLRKLPVEIYEGVKQSAKNSKRSLTQEVIFVLDNFLKEQKLAEETQKRKMEAFENLKKLHKSDPLPPLPIEWLTEDRK